jgi:DNA-binding HxlR family transcriptional regulator
MAQEELSEDRLALLEIVNDAGATICVGTCEHRKPGEFHCHNISRMMNISPNGVKKRLRELVQAGFMNRKRAEREDGKVMARYTVSSDGLKALRA